MAGDRRGYEPGLVERNGVDKLLGMLDNLREEVGELQVQGARPMGENKLAIVIDTGRHAEPLQLILDLEPAEPHRITRIEVMVGD